MSTSEELISAIQAVATGDSRQYKTILRIGTGAYGKVYRGKCRSDGREVAIKVCNCLLQSDSDQEFHEESLRDILNEVTFLKEIQHTSIVKYIDCYIKNHKVHLVTELLDGEKLSESVWRNHIPLTEKHLAAISKTTLEALNQLHGHSVMYRDLKGDNLMLDRAGNIKLIDFGFCTKDTGNVRDNVGTVDYMSPEMVRGKIYNCLSDIWALGMTLIQLRDCKGKDPYSHLKNEDEVENCIISNGRPPIKNQELLTKTFKDFLDHCLEKNLEKRWTAAALLEHPFIEKAATTDEMKLWFETFKPKASKK